MLDAKILGQLFLMQSVVNNLPTPEIIRDFVSEGLLDIPGVKSVKVSFDQHTQNNTNDFVIPIITGNIKHGEIYFEIADDEAFDPYKEYLLNFAFTIAVILEERVLRKKNAQYQNKLEEMVADQTAKLEEEIEERKQIELNLKQSESLFRKLLEQAPVAIYLIDINAKIILANKAASKMLGYSQDELVNMSIFDIRAEESTYEEFLEEWKIVKINEVIQLVDKHKTKNNSVLNVDLSFTKFFLNRQEYSLAYANDITYKQKAEKELEENRVKFQTFFNSVNDLIIVHPLVTDGYGKIMDVNKISCDVLGYTFDEFLDLTIEDITYSKALQLTNNPEFRKMMLRENSYAFETILITKAGKKLPVEISANIVEFNQQKIIIAAARDISERKESQRIEKELSERNKLILETSLNGFILTDEDANIIDVNPAYEEIIGYTKQELCKMNMSHLDEKTSLNQVKNHFTEKSNVQNFRFESQHKHKQGHNIDVSLSFSVMKQKNSVYYAGFVRDITKEKIAEQNIRKQNDEYQRLNDQYLTKNEELTDTLEQIQTINKQLEIAKGKAEESDKLKSVFLANMSHEIRTPMNGILGFADLLRSPQLTSDKQDRYISIIKKSGERMLSIINDLIDISRIEAGQIQLNQTDFSCIEILKNQYNFFLPEAEQKGLELKLSVLIDEKDSWLYSDATKFTQILTNLIKNALKFTQKGFIKLAVEKQNNSQLLFTVEDSGKGIEPGMQDKIFERFRQAKLTPEIEEEGAGLGLSISKGFAEILGGEIWVESQPEKGSKFLFTMPLIKSVEKSNVDYLNETISTTNRKLNILIAEDDEISYLFLEEILKENKHHVHWAKNGLEAVKIAREVRDIDIILMDIKMPELNGYDATRLIREFNKTIPILMQSAFVSPDDKKKAYKLGCNDFISKPVDRNELINKTIKYTE